MNDVLRRLNTLEQSCSRKILPEGYRFSVDTNGDLVVIRDSDGATSAGIV